MKAEDGERPRIVESAFLNHQLRAAFLTGEERQGSGAPDVWWFRPDGRKMTQADWSRGDAFALGAFLNGAEIPTLAPDGEPVADDFDHLHHTLFAHDSSWLDGGGSKSFWRPLAYQGYYGLLHGVIVAHPAWITALHLALYAVCVWLLYDIARRHLPGPAAAVVASFPLLLESSRALVLVPVHFVDLGLIVFSVVAWRLAEAGHCYTYGLAGAGPRLPLLLSAAAARGLPIERVARVAAENPARAFGHYPAKGALAPGSDADIVIFDPDGEAVLPGDGFGDGTGDSVYAGLATRGRIRAVLLRGQLIVSDGVLTDDRRPGRYLPAAGGAA